MLSKLVDISDEGVSAVTNVEPLLTTSGTLVDVVEPQEVTSTVEMTKIFVQAHMTCAVS